jgi:hypothetical protein
MRAISAVHGVERPSRPSPYRRRVFYGTALQVVLFAVLPAYITVFALVHFGGGDFAVDFHRQYWVAGNRVLDGLNPYDLSWQNLEGGVGFAYSAFDALLFVPFALLPHRVADWTFTLLAIGAALGTLGVLGVRDWRPYGVAVIGAPVVSAWQTANVTLFVVLGIAAAWRFRDRPFVVGTLIALVTSVKLFVWPVGVWLLATRRYSGLAWAFVAGAAINLTAWAVIGFSRFEDYTGLSRTITKMDDDRSYNLIGLGLSNGVSHGVAYGAQLAAAAAAACACVHVGRRGNDVGALTLAIAASLLAAPVIWLHYFALLLVPLALGRPRLSWAWGLPLLLYVCPVHEPTTWELLTALAVTAAVCFSAVRGSFARWA